MIGYYNKKENETQLVLFVNEKRILNYYNYYLPQHAIPRRLLVSQSLRKERAK